MGFILDFIEALFADTSDPDWLGRRGENLTEKELKYVKFFGRPGKILKNVYIPKGNGEFSEIDVMYITVKGIFVIESKNYSGWIFGNEKHTYWTACLANGTRNKFYNPIKQNRTHIRWLRKFLENDMQLNEVNIFSIIAFSERCELKDIRVDSKDMYVIKRDRLYATVRDLYDDSDDIFSEDKRDEIYYKLEDLSEIDDEVKEEHIARINKKYNFKPDREVDVSDDEDDLTCPKCGGKLVLRTIKKGANVGGQFYGCSNFPKCRYSEKIISENDDENTNEVVCEVPKENSKKCPRCGGELVMRVAKHGENAGKSFYGCVNFPKCRFVENIDE